MEETGIERFVLVLCSYFFYFCGIGIGIAQTIPPETEKNNNSLERILPKVCTIKHGKRKKKIDDTLNGECFFRFIVLLSEY